MRIYIIGSLRNPRVPEVARDLRKQGFAVFDDWFSAGPEADDCWMAKQKGDGRTYRDALAGPSARCIFQFDKAYIDRAHAVVMIAPAGKSGHLELGYAIGQGKRGYVLMEAEPERWDVMYQFANGIAYSVEELAIRIKADLVFDDPRSDVVVS